MTEKTSKLQLTPFSVESFKEAANIIYTQETRRLFFEQNGQGRLMFIPVNIFDAFNNIDYIPSDIHEDLKKAIVKGLGHAIESVIDYQLQTKYNLNPENKSGNQIFHGQLAEKKGKLYLWVEVSVFYHVKGQRIQLLYKHNFCNKDIFTEELVSKVIKSISREVDKSIKTHI